MKGDPGALIRTAGMARTTRGALPATLLIGACLLAACGPREGARSSSGGSAGDPPGADLSGSPGAAPAADPGVRTEIEALFADYLRLHAAKDMDGWQALFLPEAIAVEVEKEGAPGVYPVADLARSIAEYGRTIGPQHETLEQVRIETHGGAGTYAARYTLFIDGENVQTGRAFFSLVRRDGRWRIAALVWQVD